MLVPKGQVLRYTKSSLDLEVPKCIALFGGVCVARQVLGDGTHAQNRAKMRRPQPELHWLQHPPVELPVTEVRQSKAC